MPNNGSSKKDLRSHWDQLRERIRASQGFCILSDFDGTLVPIESRPDLPRLSEDTRRLLEQLRNTPRVVLGIVSGRALSDLVSRVGIPRLWYVGSHGSEILDPRGKEHRYYEPEDVAYLQGVQKEMEEELREIRGVLLENKGPALAVHYREVATAHVHEVERIFLRVMDRHRTRLLIGRGHAVLEARVRDGQNKGLAIRHIRYLLPLGTLMIYFGDDRSDRDAFRELQRVGVSVEVGGEESGLADYTLPDPEAVLECLAGLQRELGVGGGFAPGSRRAGV